MPPNLTSATPAVFSRAVRELGEMGWRRDLSITEIGSPQRIAPHSVAISGELRGPEDPSATGRLILLHDPAGNVAWEGTFRLVTNLRAEVDIEMVTDPLLPDVAWSWLVEALSTDGCLASALAGTVTSSHGKGFGEMVGNDQAEVEIRASWTPTLDGEYALTPHLQAWEHLMFMMAGEPHLPSGIASLPNRLR